jgi:formylmethanofuran dehydrogenase subunit E-like metal-binding protein
VIRHPRTFEFRQRGKRIAAVVSVPGECDDVTAVLVATNDRRDCYSGATNRCSSAFAMKSGVVDDTHLGCRNR